MKTTISVEVKGVTITGELLEIINILHHIYKVPSPAIYQFMGEVGTFSIENNNTSFTRPYSNDNTMYFTASVKKEN